MLGSCAIVFYRIPDFLSSIIRNIPIIISIIGTISVIVLAFLKERISIYWKNKFTLKITAVHISFNMSIVHSDGTSPKLAVVNGKPTIDGKDLMEFNLTKLVPQTKGRILNYIKGVALRKINSPYIDIYVKNTGYNNITLDNFFVSISRWRHQRIKKQSSDCVFHPISLSHQDLLYNNISIQPSVMPFDLIPGKTINFRIDTKKIRLYYKRIISNNINFKTMKHGYLAFSIISGNYLITQCSRIKMSAFN